MNCFYHPEQEAVAQCPGCGKGLCSPCAFKFSQPVCITCFNKKVNAARSEFTKEMLMTYGLGLILTFFLLKGGLFQLDFSKDPKGAIVMTVLLFYAASGIVTGWKTLTSITPQVFLILPLLGWLFYFLVKFVLAFFVGLIMLPVRTINCIFQLKRLKLKK